MRKYSVKKLSAYTIARNCSDINDCNAGIDELREYLENAKKPSSVAYIRLYKLREKIKKYQSNIRLSKKK